jgi:hypothetical protein
MIASQNGFCSIGLVIFSGSFCFLLVWISIFFTHIDKESSCTNKFSIYISNIQVFGTIHYIKSNKDTAVLNVCSVLTLRGKQGQDFSEEEWYTKHILLLMFYMFHTLGSEDGMMMQKQAVAQYSIQLTTWCVWTVKIWTQTVWIHNRM